MNSVDLHLSIVVPTKNRFIYAKGCIAALLAIESTSVEIVIADNSDDDLLQDWISLNQDSRIRYIRNKLACTVTENFQMGLDAARGHYLCTIGDDDGVHPEIVTLAAWGVRNNIDAITPHFICDYTWPDLNDHNKKIQTEHGTLRIKRFNSTLHYKNTEDSLKHISKSCATDFADFYDIPKIYYGLIKTTLLQQAKNDLGTNFPGVSPDVSGAVSICPYVKNFCVIDYPIFISGSSLKSTAGQSSLKKHHGDLTEQPHISRKAIDCWPSKIPKFFSVESVWSESALNSLHAIKRLDLIRTFNFSKIYAYTLMFNRHYYRFILPALSQKILEEQSSITKELLLITLEYINFIFLRAKYLLRNRKHKKTGETFFIANIQDIHQASINLDTFLKNKNYSLHNVLNDA